MLASDYKQVGDGQFVSSSENLLLLFVLGRVCVSTSDYKLVWDEQFVLFLEILLLTLILGRLSCVLVSEHRQVAEQIATLLKHSDLSVMVLLLLDIVSWRHELKVVFLS